MTSSLCVPLPGEAGSERMTGCNPESRGRSHAFHPRRWRRTRSRTRTSPSSSGESERTEGRAAKALRRASRAALMWPEEAGRLRDADRPFTELRPVGPFTARFISTWLREGTSVGERPPLRDGFLSYAQAREVVASHADWRTGLEGDLQMHTDETDGAASVEDMVAAARALGHHYVAITDHSKTLRITNGMDETRLAAQGERIDALNARGMPTWALRAIEMDLTPEGAGDMDPSALARLDLGLGAFHSKLRLRDDQTERYLTALANPDVHVLAHPRGRIYNFRAGLSADWERVARRAAETGTALEIDAYPDRQDLDVDRLRVVAESGGWVSIGTDAHTPSELVFFEIGIAAAILAGLPRERILITFRSGSCGSGLVVFVHGGTAIQRKGAWPWRASARRSTRPLASKAGPVTSGATAAGGSATARGGPGRAPPPAPAAKQRTRRRKG